MNVKEKCGNECSLNEKANQGVVKWFGKDRMKEDRLMMRIYQKWREQGVGETREEMEG